MIVTVTRRTLATLLARLDPFQPSAAEQIRSPHVGAWMPLRKVGARLREWDDRSC